MSHTLRFDGEQVYKLVKTTMGAKEWSPSYDWENMRPGRSEDAKPQLILVKDDGIYLISNKVYPKGVTPASAGEVVYARGYDPRKGEVWDKAHDVSGDDFSETFNCSDIMGMIKEIYLKLHSDVTKWDLRIKLSEESMTVDFIRKA